MEFIEKEINDALEREINKPTTSSAYEMAKERKDVIKTLDSLGDRLSEHLGKILIYSNSDIHRQAINHWIGEVSSWCQTIGAYVLKPNSKKLSPKEYLKYVFEGYAESEKELSWRLIETEASYRRTNSYTEVELTSERLELAWKVYREISIKFSNLFAETKLYNLREYSQFLRESLKGYMEEKNN